jgi:hypothetical protein
MRVVRPGKSAPRPCRPAAGRRHTSPKRKREGAGQNASLISNRPPTAPTEAQARMPTAGQGWTSTGPRHPAAGRRHTSPKRKARGRRPKRASHFKSPPTAPGRSASEDAHEWPRMHVNRPTPPRSRIGLVSLASSRARNGRGRTNAKSRPAPSDGKPRLHQRQAPVRAASDVLHARLLS